MGLPVRIRRAEDAVIWRRIVHGHFNGESLAGLAFDEHGVLWRPVGADAGAGAAFLVVLGHRLVVDQHERRIWAGFRHFWGGGEVTRAGRHRNQEFVRWPAAVRNDKRAARTSEAPDPVVRRIRDN